MHDGTGERGGQLDDLLPVWNSVASCGGVAESLRAAQTCRSLRATCQDKALWRQHATALRHIWPAENRDVCLDDAAPQARSLLQRVDWRLLVQLNATCSRRSISVRLRDFEMLLPLYSRDKLTALQALYQVLAKLLRELHAPGTWPFRLRWLQWGGRPGCLVDHCNICHIGAGCKMLLEWGDAPSGWPLPPAAFDTGMHFGLETTRQSTWAWPNSQGLSVGQGYMVHVISSLLPKTKQWLQVPADFNLLSLLELISQLLRRDGNPTLTHRPLHFRLVDMCPRVSPEVEHPTLRDLAWAQCETLYVEAAKPGAAPAGGVGPNSEITIVDLKRERAFSSRRDTASEATEATSVSTLVFGSTGLRSAPEPIRPLQALVTFEDGWVTPDPQRETSESVRDQLCCPPTPEVPETAGPASLDGVRPSEYRSEVTEPIQRHHKERIVPHFPPVLVPGTSKCRQFEFHPLQPDVMLVGDKDGGLKIVNTGEEGWLPRPAAQVDHCALLGLSWLRHAPNIAVCGGSTSGSIQFLRYNPDARPGKPALTRAATVQEKFMKLSSLSVNCSDNFLLASGISSSIRIFDIETGKVMSRGSGVHEHFINISRFCNTSPHIFATASFDHTCKIWDLRCPLNGQTPLKTLRTGGHNVMGTFSPDDRMFLCSGVDTRLWQFEVGTWAQTGALPLRSPLHKERYRRSAYLANSKYFVTGSTEESHIHLLSVHGQKMGCVDFRGILQDRAQQLRNPLELVRGTVCLDDADPQSGSSRSNHEYVQSIRTHPVIESRVGVLMAMPQAKESHIVLLDLDGKEVEA